MMAVFRPALSTAIVPDGDRYGLVTEADRRFRRIVARFGLPMLAFAIAVPLLHPEQALPPAPQPRTLHRVELLPPPVPVPKPMPMPMPQALPPKPLPAPTARSTPAPAAAAAAPAAPGSARARAKAAGLMQLREQLAAISERSVVSIERPQAVIGGGRPASATARGAALAAGAAASSGGAAGIGRSGVSQGAAVGDLGARRTARVQAAAGIGSGAPAGSGKGRAAGRSLEDIQLGFDRSKHAFNAIFGRAARETVGLRAGRIVVSLTVAPDGSVTRCELVSSAFGDPALEQKLLRQIRQMNFGAREVPSYTVPSYPIDYLPS